jgi:hypothetical protein
MVVYLFVVFSFGGGIAYDEGFTMGGIAYDEGFTIFLISFKHISLFNHSDKRAVVVVIV